MKGGSMFKRNAWRWYTSMTAVGLVVASCGGGQASTTPQPASTRAPAPTATAPAPVTSSATAVPTPAQTPPATSSPTGPTPRYGGTFRMRLASNYGTDLRTSTGQFGTITLMNVLNNLLTYQPDAPAKVYGDLARSWSVSQDGKVWTISLGRDALWQDGKPLTAQDVLFTFNAYLHPEDPRATAQQARLTSVASVEAPDPYTVQISLKQPSASLLGILDAPRLLIYPAHLPFFESTFKSNPVGSGPFRFESGVTSDVVIKLTRNPAYFKKDDAGRQLPYLDAIEQYIFLSGDQRPILSAFLTGKLDCLCGFSSDLLLGDVDSVLRQAPDAKVSILPSGSAVALVLGNKPPFDNVKIRQGVQIGIDRTAIHATYALGKSYYPPSLLIPRPLGGQWALPDAEVLTLPGFRTPKGQDKAQARSLFKEAGFDPSTTSFTVPVLAKDSSLSEALDAELVDMGFKRSRITILDSAANTAARLGGAFDILLSEQSVNVDLTETLPPFVLTGGAQNFGRWSFPEIDSMLQQQDGELDLTKRVEINRQLQLRLYDLAFHMPLVMIPIAYATHSHVMGFSNRVVNVTPAHRLERVWVSK